MKELHFGKPHRALLTGVVSAGLMLAAVRAQAADTPNENTKDEGSEAPPAPAAAPAPAAIPAVTAAPTKAAPKTSILSKKSAVSETKTRTGPARFTGGLSAADRDAKADQKRDEEIDELKKIIPKVQDGPQKADLLFQLAELWWEKSKFVYFTEMGEYEAAYAKYLDAQSKGQKGLTEPKVNTRQSDLYRQEAIHLYDAILTNYPSYPRKDEVLFIMAYNMYDLGKKNEALAHYKELIRQYPDSKFVPDAYVQMGEHFFNSNDLERARKSYEKALESKVPQVYAFALYKLAWCDYNAGAYEEALKKFESVVAYQEQAAKGVGKAEKRDKIQLKNEALNDMILSFAQLNQVEAARDYYAAHASRKKTHQLLARLANVYFDAGKWDPAIKTYRIIIEEDPDDSEDPSYQANIVKAFEGQRKRDQVRVELKKLVETYRPNGPWATANSHNKAALASAYDLTEGSMRELVTDYHQEAQKTKSVATYRLARDIYKEYLDNFADSENAYNLRFYYAEILWALQEWDKAAEQYELVVAKDPKGVYSKTAAYNTILSYEKLIERDAAKGGAPKELQENQKIEEKKGKGTIGAVKVKMARAKKDTKEEPIPTWEAKLVVAGDTYNKLYPGNTDEVSVRYKGALIYYEHFHYVEAANRFGDVITRWPTDKWAQIAADLTLDALNTKEEWEALNQLARKFAANKQLTKPGSEFAQRLNKLIEGSEFQIAMGVYQKKDFVKAAPLFAAFVKDFPHSEYADKALFNEQVIYENENKLDLSIPAGEKLLKDYPKSTLVQQTIEKLGRSYERIADFQQAARYYQRYANQFPDDPKAADNLFNAALWNEGLGNFSRSIDLYNQYILTYKDRKDLPEIRFTIGLINEKQQDWKAAYKSFDVYLKDYAKDLTAGKVYYAKYKQMEDLRKGTGNPADEKAAAKLADDLLKGYPKLTPDEQKEDGNLTAYAMLRFRELEPTWNRYKAIKFDSPIPAKVKATLKLKLTAMSEIQDTYTKVLGIGSGEWGIAALTRIGFGYLDFAKNLTDSPDPKGLPPDLLDQYRAELENRALPLEDKGIDAIEKALQKSSELLVYTDWVLKAQDQENKYRPGAFGEIHVLPYQGSEFFATAPLETSLEVTPPPTPAPKTAPAPAAPPAAPPKAATPAGSRAEL